MFIWCNGMHEGRVGKHDLDIDQRRFLLKTFNTDVHEDLEYVLQQLWLVKVAIVNMDTGSVYSTMTIACRMNMAMDGFLKPLGSATWMHKVNQITMITEMFHPMYSLGIGSSWTILHDTRYWLEMIGGGAYSPGEYDE